MQLCNKEEFIAQLHPISPNLIKKQFFLINLSSRKKRYCGAAPPKGFDM